MGGLTIGNQITNIKSIQIYSQFSKIYVEPQFSFTINVYNPEEKDSPLIISFDHIVTDQISSIEELVGNQIQLNEEELEKYGNLLYIQDDEHEAKSLSFTLNRIDNKLVIKGNGNLINTENDIQKGILFEGEVILTPTEIIEYDYKNYHFQRGKLIELLELISSKDDLIKYKNNIPFVHIPFEVLSDWDSAFGIQYKWYYEEYKEVEINKMKEMDRIISDLYTSYEADMDNFPDVPEIFKTPLWNKLMVTSNEFLKFLQKES